MARSRRVKPTTDENVIENEGSVIKEVETESTPETPESTPEIESENNEMSNGVDENENPSNDEGTLSDDVNPGTETETETSETVELSYDEKLAEFQNQLKSDHESGKSPFALTLLTMYQGIEPSLNALREIHKTLTYTGPSEVEMRARRASSNDEEVKQWVSEIESLEIRIAELKAKANQKLMGSDFVEPLNEVQKAEKRAQFGEIRTRVKSAIDGFGAILAMNDNYMKPFIDFLGENIPDLRKSDTKKPVSSGTGDGRGRKPMLTDFQIGEVKYEKLPKFRQILQAGYGISDDVYQLRLRAEDNGASPDSPTVEFEVPAKHTNKMTPIRFTVNYEATWDAGKLEAAKG